MPLCHVGGGEAARQGVETMTLFQMPFGSLLKLLESACRLGALDGSISAHARMALEIFDKWAGFGLANPAACKAASLVLHDRLMMGGPGHTKHPMQSL